jgi:TRAP-type C4-dicarboxylate transport system permease small subunit
MRRITRTIDLATTALAMLAGIAVTLLVAHVTLDVIFRSVIGKTLPGTIPAVSNYYMVLIVCLPLAFVERKNAHISVDVLTNLLPAGFTRHLFGWTYLLSAAIFGLVGYSSWIEALAQFKQGKFVIEQDIKIVTWIGYFAVPLGYGLGATYAVLKFIGYFTHRYQEEARDDVESKIERLSHD